MLIIGIIITIELGILAASNVISLLFTPRKINEFKSPEFDDDFNKTLTEIFEYAQTKGIQLTAFPNEKNIMCIYETTDEGNNFFITELAVGSDISYSKQKIDEYLKNKDILRKPNLTEDAKNIKPDYMSQPTSPPLQSDNHH